MPSPPNARRGCCWGGVCLAVLLLSPSASPAAVDVTGAWRLTLQLVPLTVSMVMTQSGTALTATIGIGIGSSAATGTIDPEAGVFTLAGAYVVQPGIPEAPPELTCHYVISATVSADGQTFAGTHDDDCGLHTGVGGVRETCGNGVLDPGETCDAALPCCTATCQLAPAGTACPDDGDPCTDEACDASGICQHTPNTAPCSPTGCTADTCADGICVPGAPLPAGTGCPDDGNPCTTDTCDAVGGCQHTALAAGASCADDTTSCTLHTCNAGVQCVATPRQCAPCEICFGGACLATPALLCTDASVASLLDVRVPAPGKERLNWTWEGVPPTFLVLGDFGDPRTSSQYALCLFLTSPAGSASAGTTVPPGGSCAGRPCWSALRDSFVYGNPRDAAGTGIRGMRLTNRGLHHIRVSGAGPNLGLPASLGLSSALVQLVKSGGAFPVCWQSQFTTPLVSTPGHFRARQ